MRIIARVYPLMEIQNLNKPEVDMKAAVDAPRLIGANPAGVKSMEVV